MTLLEVLKADGRLVGRCDARCYQAQAPGCHCVCGGRNHGVGLRRALEHCLWDRELLGREGLRVNRSIWQRALQQRAVRV